MAIVIAGRFDTLQTAEEAAHALMREHSIRQDDLATFYVAPPGQHHAYPIGGDHAVDPHAGKAHGGSLKGAAIGASIGLLAFVAGPAAGVVAVGIGAYTGSLIGALKGLSTDTSAETQPEEPTAERSAGVMVAVRIDPANAAESVESTESAVMDILEHHGAIEIEKAVGEVRDGEWVDFEAERPPHRVARRS